MNREDKLRIKKVVMDCCRHMLIGSALILCWWGLFMPQLLMNEDTYKIVGAEEIYVIDDYAMYLEILQADEDQVVYKSKLLEYLKEVGILQE